jgi:hypothetical protein
MKQKILSLAILSMSMGILSTAFAQKGKGELTLSSLETQVLGQNRWLKGSNAALRVIVTNHTENRPASAKVQIALTPQKSGARERVAPIVVYRGATSRMGTLEAKFTLPTDMTGACELAVQVESPLGKDEVKQNITITESAQIMLTADKPLYQPGQVMHLRALAMDMATRKPLGAQPITFEIEDARGNKVFKKKSALSKFGVGAVDFQLADEVNMGTFTLRAITPQDQIEKKVRVDRYVLPKFRVALKTEKPYYLPGELVKGTLNAKYFFGKPVIKGDVTLSVKTVDIGVTNLQDLKGTTSPDGEYKFEFTLPKFFVGQPFEQGKAVISLEATLKDSADQRQEGRISVPIVKEPVQITLVPESKIAVPKVENRLYIAAGTPDGNALKEAVLTVTNSHAPGVSTTLKTDALGIATYTFTPQDKPIQIKVLAQDANGRRANAEINIAAQPSVPGIILRIDKPLTKVGERIQLQALSSQKGGTLYLDVVRNRQTILTHAQPMEGGKATYDLPVTNDMTGTLEIHAYKILPDENIIRDTRVVVVSPAGDLKIAVTADKNEYRPGGEALLRFKVRDNQNRPVLAAMGIAIVDESVFALSELQPGLERIYFLLEKEFMEPKYEIHGLRPTGLIEMNPRDKSTPELARQRAATVVLASAEAKGNFDFRINTYKDRWARLLEKAVPLIEKDYLKIYDATRRYNNENRAPLSVHEGLDTLIKKGYLTESTLVDPWGTTYKIDLQGATNYGGYFTIASAGPDKRWGTVDDIKDINRYRVRKSRRGMMNRGGFPGAMGGAGGGFGGGGGAQFDAPFGAVNDALADKAIDAEQGQFFALAAPMERGAGREEKALLYKEKLNNAPGQPGGSAEPAVRVREYFPETMLWQPALLTNEQGEAELRIPIADSITTWRTSVMGNALDGQLGSTTESIKVFQDFFVDIDLPLTMTQNDRVEIPVAIYNYLPQAQEVRLQLQNEPWFALEGSAEQKISLKANEVKVLYYPLTVKAIGKHALMVTARGTKLSDAIRRVIDVQPDGKEFRPTINDRLDGKVNKKINLPQDAIAGASTIFVKLYPGTFSQVVEGLDGMLRMPGGCFEQTSSTAYPNVLVLDYLKQNKRVNPELQMRAEQYINVGYQRLVTFEVKSGGFSWFGEAPAHQVLTAYGLLEFSDMAKVHEVDPAVIQRTQNWLASQQKPDGTWEEKNAGIAEGIINRQTGALRTTAYIAWALAESGYQGAQLQNGLNYVYAHLNEAKDPYTLAVILNLLVRVDKNGDRTNAVAQQLIDMAKQTEKTAYWESDTKTFTGAEQKGADLETTGMAAYGLAQYGRNAGFVNKVLTHIVQSKDSFGTWSTTQGTVWSMKALLYAGKNSVGGGKGSVTVLANGKKAASFAITPEDSDVMRQVNLAEFVQKGENDIQLQYEGEGSLLYQVVGRYYLGWDKVDRPAPDMEPLDLKVDYDKTNLTQDETATVTVTIRNRTNKIAEMPLIDVGVPPGFTVVPDKLQGAVEDKRISKFTIAARQVILYLTELQPGQEVVVKYQIRAKYPIRARTPLSKAYPYYNPEKVATVAPTGVLVRK